MPNVRTMQGLLAYCAAPAPYPSFEGETQKNSKRAKDDVLRIKGRELSSDLDIDTLDNPTLARLLLSYQIPLKIKEGELVEPIEVRRNKNKTYLECRFIAPEQEAAKQILASIEMSNAPKGQRSVRDILNIMHNMPSRPCIVRTCMHSSSARRRLASRRSLPRDTGRSNLLPLSCFWSLTRDCLQGETGGRFPV